jgi:hypothetical protein
MTMHLLPAYFTSTRTTQKTKAKTTKLSKHDAWLMSQGLHPTQIAAKKDKKVLDKLWRSSYTESMVVDRSASQSHGITAGACAKPEEKIYTGDNLLGIATMHKSNMVPIFKAEDAEDIARMRRG